MSILTTTHSATFNMKYIDNTPDLQSPDYWETHNIAVVRVTAVRPDSSGIRQLTWTVEAELSDGEMDAVTTLPVRYLWFGTPDYPEVEIGDRLLIFCPKLGPMNVAAVQIQENGEESSQERSARKIAALRRLADEPVALTDAVVDPDPVVALYSLSVLRAGRDLTRSGALIPRLRRLRGLQSADGRVRLMANELLGRIEDRISGSNEDYTWLKSSVSRWAGADWTQLKPLIDKLVDYDDRRQETVRLLTRIVGDPQKPQAAKIAAYSALENPKLFRFENPDDTSDSIMQSLTRMQTDADPVIRGAGSALLHNVAVHVSPEHRARYLDRAKVAIASALATEKDTDVRHQHENYLRLLLQH